MPIRFPTEAANDPDVGREDGTPQDRERDRGKAQPDDAKPGKDINQAGFVRERDTDADRER